MDDSSSSSFQLSPMDCHMPRSHVAKVLFFPASDVEPVSIAESLKKGLELTVQLLPVLSGTVQLSNVGSQSGRLMVSEPYRTVDEMFAVNDLRAHRDYDYGKIREKQFPTYEWSESRKPDFYGISVAQKVDLPVFTAKVNFIKGGLVFVISFHHCFTDGNGVAKLMKIWCSFCTGEHPTLATDSISRSRLIGEPGLAGIQDFPQLNYVNDSRTELGRLGHFLTLLRQKTRYWVNVLRNLFMKASYQPVQKKGSLDDKQATRVLFFSNDKLKELKMLASDGKKQENDRSWISTQDALSALLWCSFVHARQERDLGTCLGSSTTSKEAVKRQSARSEHLRDQSVGMGVIINARRLLQPQLPSSFIGNVILVTGIQYPLQKVTVSAEAISAIAYSLRASINGLTPAYLSRFLSAIASVEDIRKLTYARGPNPKYRLVVSSWRGQDYYGQGWSQVFGAECERVRSTIGPLPNGLAIILPEIKGAACSASAAGLEVAIGLSEDDIPHLKENELLNHFCEWR